MKHEHTAADAAGEDAVALVSANIRRLWEEHAAETGESQPVTAASMFPWLSPPAAARELRRIMGGSWPSARCAAGIARVLGVPLSALYA